MAKWTSDAAASYHEAMKRRYARPAEAGAHEEAIARLAARVEAPVKKIAIRRSGLEIACFVPEEAVASAKGSTFDSFFEEAGIKDEVHAEAVRRVETQRPVLGYEPDEPERLRRVFATWDFRNGT